MLMLSNANAKKPKETEKKELLARSLKNIREEAGRTKNFEGTEEAGRKTKNLRECRKQGDKQNIFKSGS